MLSDLMFRRLGLGWEPSMGLDVVHRVAMEAAPVMGWSDHETRAQVAAYESFVRDHFNPQEQRTRAEAGSAVNGGAAHRSEERRGGKECVSTGRCRWGPFH